MAMKHFVKAEVEDSRKRLCNAMIPIEDIRAILEVPGQDKTVILLLDGIKAFFSWEDFDAAAAGADAYTPVEAAVLILESIYDRIESDTRYESYQQHVHAFLMECETIPVRITND